MTKNFATDDAIMGANGVQNVPIFLNEAEQRNWAERRQRAEADALLQERLKQFNEIEARLPKEHGHSVAHGPIVSPVEERVHRMEEQRSQDCLLKQGPCS